MFIRSNFMIISIKETERIERTLSADEMQGRRTFTPGIEKAANFIASEFEKTGLQKWNDGNTYLQSFSMVRTKTISQKIMVNGVELDAKKAIVVSPSASLMADNNAGYDVVTIASNMNFPTEARKALGAKKNTIVLVDTAHANMFGRFAQMRSQLYSTQPNVIMLLVDKAPGSFMLITLRAFCAMVAEEISRRTKAEHIFFMTCLYFRNKIK